MLTIDFGTEGNSARFVTEGWGDDEVGFRWMTGTQSELRIAPGLVGGDHILELDFHPFTNPPRVPAQRLTVAVNGMVLGQSVAENDGRFGYRIPASALQNSGDTTVRLSHPDAARPSDNGPSEDGRLLSFCAHRLRISPIRSGASGRLIVGTGGIALKDVERLCGIDPARFMLNFESLGNNCEFGLVQRICGAEAFLSLLRFAGMELPLLLRALDAGLHDFGDPGHVEVRANDKGRPEFLVHETRYGVFFHTFRYADEAQADKLHASESRRLSYCASRFVGELRKGSKILVVKRNDPLQEREILPLYAALSCFGSNILLWVVPADAQHSPGTVEEIMPGLLKGYIGRFAPYDDAPDVLLGDWLEVCANAYQLSAAPDTAPVSGGDGPQASPIHPSVIG